MTHGNVRIDDRRNGSMTAGTGEKVASAPIVLQTQSMTTMRANFGTCILSYYTSLVEVQPPKCRNLCRHRPPQTPPLPRQWYK